MARLTFTIEGAAGPQAFAYEIDDAAIPDFYEATSRRIGQVVGEDGERRAPTEREILAAYVGGLVDDLKQSVEQFRLNRIIEQGRPSVAVAITKIG